MESYRQFLKIPLIHLYLAPYLSYALRGLLDTSTVLYFYTERPKEIHTSTRPISEITYFEENMLSNVFFATSLNNFLSYAKLVF
jgi:hypothetical protein